jgi:hypothetical protein
MIVHCCTWVTILRYRADILLSLWLFFTIAPVFYAFLYCFLLTITLRAICYFAAVSMI